MMRSRIVALVITHILVLSTVAGIGAQEPQQLTATAHVGAAGPKIISLVTENLWTPFEWTTVTVDIQDNNMNLENVTLMAYENILGSTDPDNVRNHYTWIASKSTGTWQFSCPLGDTYIDANGCSVTENTEENRYTVVFRIRVAKIAAPTNWDLYARAVDNVGLSDSLENTNAISVQTYLLMTLSTNQLTFVGLQGENVEAAESPVTVTVTSNVNFNLQVKAQDNWTLSGQPSIPVEATKALGEADWIPLSIDYQNVWTNVGYGESVVKQIRWRLDIPVNADTGEHTNIFYIRIISL